MSNRDRRYPQTELGLRGETLQRFHYRDGASVSVRWVAVLSIFYGVEPPQHYPSQWLMRVYDLDLQMEMVFAMSTDRMWHVRPLEIEEEPRRASS